MIKFWSQMQEEPFHEELDGQIETQDIPFHVLPLGQVIHTLLDK